MQQSIYSDGGGGFLEVCKRGNTFPWPQCCAIVLTQFGTVWVWDANIGRKVQYCENWVLNAVNCSYETACKWRKHLISYTQRNLTVPKGELGNIFWFPLSLPPFLTSCSNKMTKKVEKSGFQSILHWVLQVCRDELRFDLNWSRKISLFSFTNALPIII